MPQTRDRHLRVAIAGLGAIGSRVLREVTRSEPNLHVVSLADLNSDRTCELMRELHLKCSICSVEDLHNGADVVVECLPASAFASVADSTVRAKKTLIVLSASALLQRDDLLAAARAGEARIVVPTGAILGLDVVRAMNREGISSCVMITRKPPAALSGAPYLLGTEDSLSDLKSPIRLFRGSAREAAKGFPANVNSLAALCLVALGPDDTQCEIWADPCIHANEHLIEVQSPSARVRMSIVAQPSSANPRTSLIAAFSVVDVLHSLVDTLRIGS